MGKLIQILAAKLELVSHVDYLLGNLMFSIGLSPKKVTSNSFKIVGSKQSLSGHEAVLGMFVFRIV
jgi:hypothetical protein